MGVGRRNLVHAPGPRKETTPKCRRKSPERPLRPRKQRRRKAVRAGRRHVVAWLAGPQPRSYACRPSVTSPASPPLFPVSPRPWASTVSACRAVAAPRGPEAYSGQVREHGSRGRSIALVERRRPIERLVLSLLSLLP